jgi:hypothetical protein
MGQGVLVAVWAIRACADTAYVSGLKGGYLVAHGSTDNP